MTQSGTGGVRLAGASSGMYPAAYHFFERMRIVEGKPKSATRKKNEEVRIISAAAAAAAAATAAESLTVNAQEQGPNGFPLEHDSGMRWVMGPSPATLAMLGAF